jgi:triosephosphate isomerase
VNARTPLIVGNWKMHRDHLEAIQLLQRLAYHLTEEDTAEQESVVCPPFTALRSLQTLIQSDRMAIALGAQDCHPDPEGAHTGDISVPMLARLDVRYVIVGHSERRLHHGEDDALVARKARAASRVGCGRSSASGRARPPARAVRRRTSSSRRSAGSLVGVEPCGGGRPRHRLRAGLGDRDGTDRDADRCAGHGGADPRRPRRALRRGDVAAGIRILYGGSVKPANIRSIMTLEDVDGVLVGGASLSAEDFALIVGHRRGV